MFSHGASSCSSVGTRWRVGHPCVPHSSVVMLPLLPVTVHQLLTCGQVEREIVCVCACACVCACVRAAVAQHPLAPPPTTLQQPRS